MDNKTDKFLKDAEETFQKEAKISKELSSSIQKIYENLKRLENIFNSTKKINK